jgi:hypothetical protein
MVVRGKDQEWVFGATAITNGAGFWLCLTISFGSRVARRAAITTKQLAEGYACQEFTD